MSTQPLTSAELRQLTSIMLNIRQFCGNLHEAVKEWEAENHPISDEDYAKAFDVAAMRWEECKF